MCSGAVSAQLFLCVGQVSSAAVSAGSAAARADLVVHLLLVLSIRCWLGVPGSADPLWQGSLVCSCLSAVPHLAGCPGAGCARLCARASWAQRSLVRACLHSLCLQTVRHQL